ncbi:MAG: type II toxin-antitoxin system VapC family toxin [Betaproteobacteria bacterium]
MAFVVDNSVVVAWFIASQANAGTEALLGRAAGEDVRVPVIWPAEFAAALLTLSHRRRLQPARLPAILDEIDQLDFIHDSAPPTTRSPVAIARRHALSAYDACYLELALRLRLPLAARDAPLRRAAERAGVLLV